MENSLVSKVKSLLSPKSSSNPSSHGSDKQSVTPKPLTSNWIEFLDKSELIRVSKKMQCYSKVLDFSTFLADFVLWY